MAPALPSRLWRRPWFCPTHNHRRIGYVVRERDSLFCGRRARGRGVGRRTCRVQENEGHLRRQHERHDMTWRRHQATLPNKSGLHASTVAGRKESYPPHPTPRHATHLEGEVERLCGEVSDAVGEVATPEGGDALLGVDTRNTVHDALHDHSENTTR